LNSSDTSTSKLLDGVVEEEDGSIGPDGRACRLEDRPADLLEAPRLRAEPCDRAEHLELVDALGALGAAPDALASAPRGEREPDGRGEARGADRDGDEDRRLDGAALAEREREEDELLAGGADEQETRRQRQGGPREAALSPRRAQKQHAEPEQGDSEPEEEHGPHGRSIRV
jgi:hypothetical protein